MSKKEKSYDNKSLSRYLCFTASFMIALIVSLPIYSASVFADISSIGAVGSDNIEDYVKEDDYIEFRVSASLDDDDAIDESQVWLGENLQFSSCSASVDGFDCTIRYPESGTSKFLSRPIPYTVHLKDDSGEIVESDSGKVYVDNIPPIVNSFSVEPTDASTGNVEFSYSIEDRSCYDSSCDGRCSGIKELELYTEDEAYKEIIPLNIQDCTYSESFEKDVAEFGDGDHTIYMIAYDRLGHVSNERSVSLSVDSTAPQILTSSFKITDATGLDNTYASSRGFNVTFYVEIAGDDLDRSSVKGDFRSIDAGEPYATCGETVDDVTECTWKIKLELSEETTLSLGFYAKDLAGNQAEASISRNFKIDDTGPIVKSIKTDKVKDDKSYAKRFGYNEIVAEFTEEHSGMSPEYVLFHFNDGGKVPADSCDGNTCLKNYYVDTPNLIVHITDDTTDRVGNPSNHYQQEITVGEDGPEIINVSFINIGGENAAIPGYVKTGDALQISMYLDSEDLSSAVVDLSPLINGSGNVSAQACYEIENNIKQCIWTTDNIDAKDYQETELKFYIEDFIGIKTEYTEPITIYSVIDSDTPNYWRHSVTCSPSSVDRQTTSLISQKVYCYIKLRSNDEDIKALSSTLGNCAGDTTALQDYELINNDDSEDLYMKINLKQSEFKTNSIELDCPIYIMTKVDDSITANPEAENVSISIRFYNMPLGELEESLEKDIKDAVEEATGGIMDTIGALNQILFYAKQICTILNTYYNVVGALYGVAYLLKIATVATASNPFTFLGASVTYTTGVKACAAEQGVKASADGLFKTLDPICKFVTCQYQFEWQEKIIGSIKDGKYGFNKWPGAKYLAESGRSFADYLDPENSLIIAVLFVCLPGIVYNLEKYRQIQCAYALCMKEGIEQEGLSKEMCDDQKAYATCKYVTGELFAAFPYTAFFNKFLGMIKEALMNPFTLIGLGITALCFFACPEPTATAYTLCEWHKVASMIGRTAQSVTNIMEDGFFEIKGDYCEKLEKYEEG